MCLRVGLGCSLNYYVCTWACVSHLPSESPKAKWKLCLLKVVPKIVGIGASFLRVETALGLSSSGDFWQHPSPWGTMSGRLWPTVCSLWSTCWCLFLLQDISFSLSVSKHPPSTPPKCILSCSLRYSSGSTEDTGKANKLGHVCPQLFNCFAIAIQAKLFKRFMSNIFPPGCYLHLQSHTGPTLA